MDIKKILMRITRTALCRKQMSLSLLTTLLLATTLNTYALVSDLNANDIVNVSTTTTRRSFTPGSWYAMYSVGRNMYLYGNARVTGMSPSNGSSVSRNSAYLFRFVSAGGSKYYIQTAEGSYFKDLTQNANAGVTSDIAEAGQFTVEEIFNGTGWWYVKGGTYIMDCNQNNIIGSGTEKPTDVNGSNSWRIFPVSITDPADLTGGDRINYLLTVGGLYRLHNYSDPSRYICEDTLTHTATTQSLKTYSAANGSVGNPALAQMWIMENDEGGIALRNALTGLYLQEDYTLKQGKSYWTGQLSPNNRLPSDTRIILYQGSLSYGSTNCVGLADNGSSLQSMAYLDNHRAEWTMETILPSEVDTGSIRANLNHSLGIGSLNLEAGAYYQFYSLNTGSPLTENLGSSFVFTESGDSTTWNQYWKVEYDSAKQTYTIRNVLTSKYLSHKAANENSSCGGAYVTSNMNTQNRPWLIRESAYPWVSTYVIAEPNKPSTALAAKDATSLNAEISATSAQWIVKRADLTDSEVEDAADAYADYRTLRNSSSQILNSLILPYFDDYACTRLKAEYQAMSDDSLRSVMRGAGVPRTVINIALKVKHDQWGHREKEFRIHDYPAYSDPNKWNAQMYTGTDYQFSPQTGPTGISVKESDVVLIFCDANPQTNTTLSFSSNTDYDIEGQGAQLKRGINVFVANQPGFLFIRYTITNANLKLADVRPIKIHIEGGRVQGYFDITRGHTNADWKDMAATMFEDEIIHLRSKYYEFNMNYKDLLKQIDDGELDEVDTDGTPKGIEGTLIRWDSLVASQRYLMGVDQFLDRFNCVLSASSSSRTSPYAGGYGTYYPGVSSIMNYSEMTRGHENDEGGNFWAVAHETGHIHQGLINMAGCTEISNNFFAQVNVWQRGSNTGRGGPWKVAQQSFNDHAFWNDYNLWQRSRMYFQLWLYFHLQGHDTSFYPKLFDKMRAQPMTLSRDSLNPGSGTTDYLRFAQYCCDVAQADLSEFFQFWGMFVPVRNYVIDDYGKKYFTTTLDEIDAAKAYMHKYPKKLGNILFIDERIEPYPAHYPGMPEGATRWGTSESATPGDASEVGETGMFTQFVNQPDYQPYTYTYNESTGQCSVDRTSGNGAVGFKVYNSQDEMVYVSNTYTFTVPQSVRTQPFYIMVALGDGSDRTLYDPNDLTGINDAVTDNHNAQPLDVSAPVFTLDGTPATSLQKGQIYIQNGKKVKY